MNLLSWGSILHSVVVYGWFTDRQDALQWPCFSICHLSTIRCRWYVVAFLAASQWWSFKRIHMIVSSAQCLVIHSEHAVYNRVPLPSPFIINHRSEDKTCWLHTLCSKGGIPQAIAGASKNLKWLSVVVCMRYLCECCCLVVTTHNTSNISFCHSCTWYIQAFAHFSSDVKCISSCTVSKRHPPGRMGTVTD